MRVLLSGAAFRLARCVRVIDRLDSATDRLDSSGPESCTAFRAFFFLGWRRDEMSRVLLAATVAALTATASAQALRPKATLSPRVAVEAVTAGDTVRLQLDVALPTGLHVQSNKPRDPSLIATSLTIAAPAGVTVVETLYPRPTTFTLSGGSQPLDVFGERFSLGVTLAVAETVDGDVVVP